jgi:hypothetical protein
MKNIIATLLLGFVYNVNAAEVKEVCHDRVGKDGKPVVDKKTGKTAQDCKKIKVHKKLEGTKVPEKAPKK